MARQRLSALAAYEIYRAVAEAVPEEKERIMEEADLMARSVVPARDGAEQTLCEEPTPPPKAPPVLITPLTQGEGSKS